MKTKLEELQELIAFWKQIMMENKTKVLVLDINDIDSVVFKFNSVLSEGIEVYEGELNSKRIKAYQELSKLYNIEEGTVGYIFGEGLKWANEQLTKRQLK